MPIKTVNMIDTLFGQIKAGWRIRVELTRIQIQPSRKKNRIRIQPTRKNRIRTFATVISRMQEVQMKAWKTTSTWYSTIKGNLQIYKLFCFKVLNYRTRHFIFNNHLKLYKTLFIKHLNYCIQCLNFLQFRRSYVFQVL